MRIQLRIAAVAALAIAGESIAEQGSAQPYPAVGGAYPSADVQYMPVAAKSSLSRSLFDPGSPSGVVGYQSVENGLLFASRNETAGVLRNVGPDMGATESSSPTVMKAGGGLDENATKVEEVGFHGLGCCDTGCCDTGCCDTGCCGSCGCGPCCTPCFWVAGVEATFLGVDAGNAHVGYNIVDTIYSPAYDDWFGTRYNAPLNDFYVAPRLYLGVQHCNWGLIARFWNLNANDNVHDGFDIGGDPYGSYEIGGYSIYNQLDMYTIDLEGTYSFCHCGVKNQISFGVRHANAELSNAMHSVATVNDGGGGTGIITTSAYAESATHGTGITGSWLLRKPLFCNSCVHLIGGLRGSVLWGCSHASAETLATVTGGAAAQNYAFASNDKALFIGEAQLGLQWDYCVKCFPADAFFRIMAEYQYWGAANGYASSTSFAGYGAAVSEGTSTAYAETPELDLYGFSIGTGFTW